MNCVKSFIVEMAPEYLDARSNPARKEPVPEAYLLVSMLQHPYVFPKSSAEKLPWTYFWPAGPGKAEVTGRKRYDLTSFEGIGVEVGDQKSLLGPILAALDLPLLLACERPLAL